MGSRRGAPGSSWGFGALLKGLTSVVDNICRSRDSNPQPRVTSPTLYPLGHDSPIKMPCQVKKNTKKHNKRHSPMPVPKQWINQKLSFANFCLLYVASWHFNCCHFCYCITCQSGILHFFKNIPEHWVFTFVDAKTCFVLTAPYTGITDLVYLLACMAVIRCVLQQLATWRVKILVGKLPNKHLFFI